MSNILVIVVVYKKALEDLRYILNLEDVQVLIYDNSPLPQSPLGNIHYYHNAKNPGVSEAYNYGFRLAKKLGLQYCLLLDQDSYFDQYALDHYLVLLRRYSDQYMYAPIIVKQEKIYSPFIELWHKNAYQFKTNFEYQELFELDSLALINSGLLIPVKIFEEIGGFNSLIKLDFSDIYFVEKYKLINSLIVLVPIEINHSISGDEGLDAKRELNRFRYFCNGAREYKKCTKNESRVDRLVIYRTLRLALKYWTTSPFEIATDYYLGNEKI